MTTVTVPQHTNVIDISELLLLFVLGVKRRMSQTNLVTMSPEVPSTAMLVFNISFLKELLNSQFPYKLEFLDIIQIT